MRPERVLVALLILSALVTIGWVAWVVAVNARRHRTNQLQSELHTKLLDKLGTSQELLAYLETDAGQRMVRSVGDQADPAGRVLGAMHTGVVLAALGVGFLVCEGSLPGASSTGVFMALGIIAISLGAGFLISSGISYAFSKAWGLLGRD